MEAHRVNHFTLVPRREEPAAGRLAVRRYSLARLGTHPRSALGADRLGRLEEVAGHDLHGRSQQPG